MVLRSWWNHSPCSSLTTLSSREIYQDNCIENGVWCTCCILSYEMVTTNLFQRFHSYWSFHYWESFPLLSQMKTMLPFPYHSSLRQNLDCVQVHKSVVHQTHLPWSSRMTKRGEPRLCVESINRQYLILWQTISLGPAWCAEEEIWSFLNWQLNHWQYLSYQFPESYIRTTLSGSNACLLLGCPTCK